MQESEVDETVGQYLQRIVETKGHRRLIAEAIEVKKRTPVVFVRPDADRGKGAMGDRRGAGRESRLNEANFNKSKQNPASPEIVLHSVGSGKERSHAGPHEP